MPEGLKIVEMSSNFYQGTTTTHTTLQASQSSFDLVATEISARNEISIQSLLKIRFGNDVSGCLIYSLRAWVSCAEAYYLCIIKPLVQKQETRNKAKLLHTCVAADPGIEVTAFLNKKI